MKDSHGPVLLLGLLFALSLCSAHAALPLTWQMSNPPPTNTRLNAATYGNGRFVAVGAERTILTSENAVDWSLRTNGTPSAIFWSAVSGNGKFVAGGEAAALVASS